MPFRLVALVLITSMCAAQTPTALTPQGPAPAQENITVPQGTLVALKLITQIKSKSTRPGDPVRAVVAFPLAVGAHVAIPAGTYVEGVVNKVNAHPTGGAPATIQLRFNRLLFANGYSVPLVAANTQAMAPVPQDPRRSTDVLADARDGAPYLGEGFSPAQSTPQPPPLPSTGPSPGKIAGISIGIFAGVMVTMFAIAHHRATSTDYVLFDSGWQFQMAVQEPLTLDAAQVSAAAASAN